MTIPVRDPVRIGNCSGFYGDRLSAMREMLTGGELDYLTGDYLAELTMLILARDRAKSPDRGYAKTFLTQLEECLGTAIDQGVRIVANAGGLNPAGLAAAVRALADRLGIAARVAHVEGDDLVSRAGDLGFGTPLAANAYLGAWGIVDCLNSGADVVVTGRVTDASVIVGPGRRPLRLGPRRLRPARGCGGRGPRHRMRCAGHRRQLRVLHRSARPDVRGLPAGRDQRRRVVGDHQARRDRRAGQRRHRHRPAALRDHRRALRESRCDAADGQHRAVGRRHRPGAHRRRAG